VPDPVLSDHFRGVVMESACPHLRQSAPLVFINGRSGFFAGNCSSETTTGVLLHHLRNAHHMAGEHLTYPPTQAFHWWSRAYRRLVATALHAQIDRIGQGRQVDVVAHSLGCDAVREIMTACPQAVFRRVLFIAPAMERDIKWDRFRFERMLVMRNPKDGAILAGAALPWHPFGLAGRDGFATDDPRIRDVVIPGDARMDWRGHNHYFMGETLCGVGLAAEEFFCQT
jgi:hypothetical protein